ncbi:ABC transporter ATP-binding protein [Myroides marinus]|uniref:ABC transporter ATP-binding protein n=2 Tax=Myroides TaxID=76831 RepID=UPI002575A7C7|nr:ABC transporter ATP-binding protein [Myroides marinus]MDM1348762.1 ABC transporter ATP-binding protein [Myroides marinus]MDM1352374.1 ABC transporter ATP-binding protein [Myroides marinus]MDM1359580.1 ABC transporter ATP-binding protein [Myroides marinus]MDM1366708.1 ABC transporter ATP-binding protein [Myroides marinus]MDM1370261.1 ABC transporter ATP-binding protein [Myroides marinus]
MPTPILKTENLSIGYPQKKGNNKVVQQQLNVELNKGSLTSLLGINGIGKSTLLRSISSNQDILDGKVYVNSKELKSYNKATLATLISIVLTEKIPVSDLTVHELIQIGRTPYLNSYSTLSEEDSAQVDRAILLTEITELADRHINQLSDGQLQRVLIARAIAQDTPIIILDEPSNHLDLHHKVALFKLLQRLAHEENKAILFSCHDMDLAIAFSDDIIVLKKDYNTQNKTDSLISQGVFDNFFEDENLTFNREQKRFILSSQ